MYMYVFLDLKLLLRMHPERLLSENKIVHFLYYAILCYAIFSDELQKTMNDVVINAVTIKADIFLHIKILF